MLLLVTHYMHELLGDVHNAASTEAACFDCYIIRTEREIANSLALLA
jgi:hypothetical protein